MSSLISFLKSIKVLIFLSIIYFPIFMHLERMPIRLWDESRIVISSLEMYTNGNFIVTHFNGEPDMWSTKPPLLPWLQVLCLKIFGVRELSFRLPSALAALATVLLMVWFSKRYINNSWFGIIASIVLVTSVGYINEHAVRTADFDSLLALNTTAYCLFFFLFLYSNRLKYLHLFYVFLTLTIFTKNSEGLMFLPGLGLYFLISKKYKILSNKWVYIDAIISLVVVSSFFLLRESMNSGYISQVISHDYGLLHKTVENHKHPFTYFLELFISERFDYWFWLIPLGLIAGIINKDEKVKNFSIFLTSLILSYLTLISISSTKVAWYDVPLYPLMAFSVSLILFRVFQLITELEHVGNSFLRQLLGIIFLIGIFLYPYTQIIDRVYAPVENEHYFIEYSMSKYMRECLMNDDLLLNVKVCYMQPIQQVLAYVKILNHYNSNIKLEDYKSIVSGDIVLSSQEEIQTYLESKFYFNILDAHDFVKKYEILENRN